ncbi:MAG: neutral zinc metallopeptidase [Roseiarcus sp.]|jgi:predicted metalloprotease|uniref:KPN_02809 family neutral zinc metallopeptidase n=1 Tax=Roseiarcus sp. TaxID=1969460 RepID=UPI003C1DFFD0
MEWENTPLSDNVEDRRGGGGGGLGGFGGTGGLGLGTILILTIIGYFTGIDPRMLIGGAEVVSDMRAQAPQSQAAAPGADDKLKLFVRHVLGETEAVWADALPAQTGVSYQPATLVLYDGATQSGCGGAQAAMGPFYCPLDKKVYLDLSFFRDMETKYGGGGDFADAYVIAHEIGHHVQDLLGILAKTDAAKENASQTTRNAISVRVELMADCLAGVWAANANQKWKLLDPGDVEKAVATAGAIGDDRLQTAARGYAVPDSFTHGSSAMRVKWLTVGLQSGKVDACDTFKQ